MPGFGYGYRRPARRLRRLIGGGGGGGVQLPQQASIVARFRTDQLPVVADGTAVSSWVDMISGTATLSGSGATRLTYKNNAAGGKPSLVSNGTQGLVGAVAAVSAALTAGECTMLVVYQNAQPTTTHGIVATATAFSQFAVNNGGTSGGKQWCGTGYAPPANDIAGAGTAVVDNAPTGFATGAITVSQSYNGVAGRATAFVNGLAIGHTNVSTYAPANVGAGNNNSLNAGFKGEILEIIFWNRRITQYEMIQADMAARDYYGQAYGWASSPYIFIALGDSITDSMSSASSYAAAFPRAVATTNALPFGAWANHGWLGKNPVQLKACLDGERLADITTLTGKPVKFIYGEYYNARSTAAASNTTLLAAIKAVAGNKVLFWDLTDYGTPARGTEKANYVAYWNNPANRAGLMDDFYQLSSDPNMGLDNTAGNSPTFPLSRYFSNVQGIPATAVTGASITAGTNVLTTTNDLLNVGVYIDHPSLPANTYITVKNGVGNYTLSANASATITSQTIGRALLQKGDFLHPGDAGYAYMASLFAPRLAAM